MEPYDPQNKCPKCGHDTTTAKFHEETFDDGCIHIPCEYPDGEAHIERRCSRCSAVWFERPLDAAVGVK